MRLLRFFAAKAPFHPRSSASICGKKIMRFLQFLPSLALATPKLFSEGGSSPPAYHLAG